MLKQLYLMFCGLGICLGLSLAVFLLVALSRVGQWYSAGLMSDMSGELVYLDPFPSPFSLGASPCGIFLKVDGLLAYLAQDSQQQIMI